MKKWIKKVTALSLVLISVLSLNVSAAEKVTKLGLTKTATDNSALTIASALIFSYIPSTEIFGYRNMMTAEEYGLIENTLLNAKGYDDSVYVQESFIAYSRPDLSSTKDTVIIVDMKVNYGSYNQMYLVEFHVNSGGLIYGHNIWVL